MVVKTPVVPRNIAPTEPELISKPEEAISVEINSPVQAPMIPNSSAREPLCFSIESG